MSKLRQSSSNKKRTNAIVTICISIIFLNAQNAYGEPLIELQPIPAVVEEGAVVRFSGIVQFDSQPLIGIMTINDAVTGTTIAEFQTDNNGVFHYDLVAVARDETYLFYLEFIEPREGLSIRSSLYELTVIPIEREPPSENLPTESEPELGNNEPDLEYSYEFYEELISIISIAIGIGAYTFYRYKKNQQSSAHVEIRGGLEQ